MKYVSITGKSRSGKDTLADLFISLGGSFEVQKVAFADEPKRILMNLYKFTEEELWGPSELRNLPGKYMLEKKSISITPRQGLQKLSQNFARDYYDGTWCDFLMEQCEDVEKNSIDRVYSRTYHDPWVFRVMPEIQRPHHCVKTIVVPDTRYSNEHNALKNKNAVMIKIYKDGAGLLGELGQHSSETEQDQIPDSSYDFVVYNNGTLENLRERVERIWNQINT